MSCPGEAARLSIDDGGDVDRELAENSEARVWRYFSENFRLHEFVEGLRYLEFRDGLPTPRDIALARKERVEIRKAVVIMLGRGEVPEGILTDLSDDTLSEIKSIPHDKG